MIALGLSHSLAPAAAPAPVGTPEWFDHRLSAAQVPPEFDGIFLHVIEEKWIDAGQAELDALAEKVRGRPEHPRAEEFAQLEHQVKQGPPIWTYRIWRNGNRWRISVDTTDESVPFVFMDTASPDGRLAWRVRDDVLEFFDLDHLPDGRDPGSEMARLPGLLSRFLTGGLNHGELDLRAQSSTLSGDSWRGIAANEETGRSRVYRGVVDEDANLILESWTEDSPSEPRFHGQVFRFADWFRHEEIGLTIPRVISQTYPSGNPKSRWTLVEARPATGAEVADVAAAPDPLDPSDPLRDLDEVVEVRDYRPGQNTIRSVDGEVFERLPPSERSRRRGAGFHAAWIGAGIAIALIVTYRLMATNRRNTP